MTNSPNNPNRRSNGTFAEKTTGNPKGRPPKDRRILHPETIRDMITDVAEFAIPTTLGGKKFNVNLMQANLLILGLAGANRDTVAAREFLASVQFSVKLELQEMARLAKRLDDSEPAYLRERDPAKRQELYEALVRAVRAAGGSRPRTTKGLGRRTRNRRP